MNSKQLKVVNQNSHSINYSCINTFDFVNIVPIRACNLVFLEKTHQILKPPTMGKQLVNFIACGCEHAFCNLQSWA
jgi:hypothetical protein